MTRTRTGSGENVSASLRGIFGTAGPALSDARLILADDSPGIRADERFDFAMMFWIFRGGENSLPLEWPLWGAIR